MDSFVLKYLSLMLKSFLPKATKKKCTHLEGGLKKSVNQSFTAANHYSYVLKVDIKSFYTSMDHEVLYQIIQKKNKRSKNTKNLMAIFEKDFGVW